MSPSWSLILDTVRYQHHLHEEVKRINSAFVKPIPLIESGVSIPKHEIGKPLSVPVFDKTGEANPIQPFQIYLKNLDC